MYQELYPLNIFKAYSVYKDSFIKPMVLHDAIESPIFGK